MLVDTTTGHELLSFMDMFFGYNQILMYLDDQKKTSFIIERDLFCYKAVRTLEHGSNISTAR